MDRKEIVSVLSRYNKWKRGRGRKYAEPTAPFCASEVCDAIDSAVRLMRTMPCDDDIPLVCDVVECSEFRRIARDFPKDTRDAVARVRRVAKRIARVRERFADERQG